MHRTASSITASFIALLALTAMLVGCAGERATNLTAPDTEQLGVMSAEAKPPGKGGGGGGGGKTVYVKFDGDVSIGNRDLVKCEGVADYTLKVWK